MSTTIRTDEKYYRSGAKYVFDDLGYDYSPLVGRFHFHTPNLGASSFSFVTEGYYAWGGDYQYHDPGFHFLVTERSSGYEGMCGTELGQPVRDGDECLTGASSVELMPDADYYLWIWPDSDLYSRVSVGTVWVTLDGSYGTPSQITVSEGCFGAQIPVSLSVSTPGAEHTLTVNCAGRSETLLSRSSATGCVWTPDLEIYADLLPRSGSAEAVFTCQTFYEGNCVGSCSATITVRFAQGSLAPTLSPGWAEVRVLNTGAAAGFSCCIPGYSRAEVSFDSTKIVCKNGASVAQTSILCAGQSCDAAPYRTQVLTGDAEILCTVTDSRGQQASQRLTLPAETYSPPCLSEATVFRCDSAGEPADDGQYYSARGHALFSPLNGENSVSLSVAHKQSEAASFGTETALQNDTSRVIGTISADSSYQVRLTVTDGLGNAASVTTTLATQHWAMKFRPGGMGVGFGKAPEHDNCIELPAGWVIRIGSTVIDGT